ncbi:MAG: 3-oxoacid CoA-transferase subunit B [Chloroflexota bacterium]
MEQKGLTRELIGARIARELREGMYVNLGLGLPTMVANFIPEDLEVFLHSENGILGCGRIATDEEWDIDLLNAGGQPITLRPGGSFFHSADAFAMIRGGHLDVSILGAFQVSEKGDLANWARGEARLGNIGGAMDLCGGARRKFVYMEHTTRDGAPRIVRECTYPLTARGVVNAIFTNLAVIDVTPGGLVLREVAPGVTPEEVQAVTEPRLQYTAPVPEMVL